MGRVSKVLVLEDVVETARWLAERIRSALGAEVSVTLSHTLAAAHRMADQDTYDLYLVDLGLPDGDGVDFIRNLDPARTGANIVVTTIYDDDDHVFRALRAGAHGYLLKDQSNCVLEAALQGLESDLPALSPDIAPVEPCDLTPREREVLVLIAGGLSVLDAAKRLTISVHTVRGYVKDIYRKLGISSRAEASLKAVRMGLIHQS